MGEVELSSYLLETRNGWSATLVQRRNALEHEGWVLSNVRHVEMAGEAISAVEPVADGLPVSTFCTAMLAHVMSFVEETLAFAVQKQIAPMLDLIEISLSARNPSNAQRFRIGSPALEPNREYWRLRYNALGFYHS